VGRRPFAHRCALVCADVQDAAEALEARDPKRLLTAFEEPRHRPLCFAFPGQGSQYVHMGRGLYEEEPLFRETVDRCAATLEAHLGFDLLSVLYPAAGEERAATEQLNQTAAAQPALFAVEYALARLFQAWGLHPEAMIGHSIGELVAACVAGVFALDDALALVAERGRLIQQLPAGSMLGVSLPEEEVRSLLEGRVSLAAVNAPGLCTLSGSDEAIDELQARLESQGTECRRLHTSHAFHSLTMEPILDRFAACVERIPRSAPAIPFVSNVTGTWITAEEATDPRYWASHLRQTVRFAGGLQLMLAEEDRVLLEVGPGRTLRTFARLQQAPAVYTSLRHPHDEGSDRVFLLSTLGRLWLCGLDVDWRAFYGDDHPGRIPLPTYPFARERHWIDRQPGSTARAVSLVSPDRKPNPEDWFYAPHWKPCPLPASNATPSDWIVFGGGAAPGTDLATRLRAMGHTVDLVRAGDGFAAPGAHSYEIDPNRSEDYDRVLEALSPTPERMVYCAGRDFDFYGLIHLAQALWRRELTRVHLDVVTINAQQVAVDETVDPLQALALGPVLVIPQEHPGLTCRAIDVASPSRDWQAAQLHDGLVAELTADAPDVMVAHRGGQRWVQAFEPIRPPGDGSDRLREEGVYLITGGLEPAGRALARYLAEKLGARLVLIRDPARAAAEAPPAADPAEDQDRFVHALEAEGTQVLVVTADVADAGQVQAAIAQARQRFGALHGVIHAAGIGADGTSALIQEISRPSWEVAFRPMIEGTLALGEALRDQELDFCLLFSSSAAVLGGMGFVGYAAASRFANACAQRYNQAQRTPWTSINWDMWRFSSDGPEGGVGASVARLALSPDEGVRSFAQALSLGRMPQVVVSAGDLQARLELWVTSRAHVDDEERAAEEPAEDGALLGRHPRPALGTPYVAPRTKTEETLAEMWQDLLGVDRVGIYDDFFELGGHSLLATRVISLVRSTLELELPLRAMFEAVNVAEMAKRIDVIRWAARETLATREARSGYEKGSI
jgi:acyl transferase domain-containing protein